MRPQVIIIGEQDAPVVAEIEILIANRDQMDFRVLNTIKELKNIHKQNLQGFIIFSLPSSKLRRLIDYINTEFQNLFLAFYGKSLFVMTLDNLIHVESDFVIAGEHRKENLIQLLRYLELNYWKKIPLSLLNLENGSITKNMRRIIFAFEILDPADYNLQKISKKTGLLNNVIKQEIQRAVQMTFTEVKNQILSYYKNYFPERIY